MNAETYRKYSTDLSMVLTFSDDTGNNQENSSEPTTSAGPITDFKMILVGDELVGKSSVGLRLSGRFYEFKHRTFGRKSFYHDLSETVK